jgi:hypothetical protein
MISNPLGRQGSGAHMDWLVAEFFALAGPAYFFLQILMARCYRGRWRLATLVPLVLMLPLAFHAALAYAAGSAAWPVLLILASPVAMAYLLAVATLKAWAG